MRPRDARAAARAAVVTLLALCVIGAALARPEPARAASTAAISAMNGWSLHGLSASDLDTQLALMESEGVRVLRVDASWSSIQPSAGGGYSWGAEDAEVAALAAHHIQWLPIVDYSAPWAATNVGDWRSPPADDSQFAAFAAAIAARYGPGGAFWLQNPQLPYVPVDTFEIWNEENATYYWDTGPNPGQYAQLYLAARSAIDAVDPAAQVMVGGLTNPQQGMSALQFIAQMFAQDPAMAGNVDAVALHPYAATAQGVVSNVAEARALLDSLGQDATTIDVTEFGWQVGATSAAEQVRAEMMSQVAQELGNSNCGIGLIAPYDWEDPSYITGGDWGVADETGVRPAGVSWFAGLTAAAQAPQTTPCQPSPADSPSPLPPIVATAAPPATILSPSVPSASAATPSAPAATPSGPAATPSAPAASAPRASTTTPSHSATGSHPAARTRTRKAAKRKAAKRRTTKHRATKRRPTRRRRPQARSPRPKRRR